jgi:hypothetical protein
MRRLGAGAIAITGAVVASLLSAGPGIAAAGAPLASNSPAIRAHSSDGAAFVQLSGNWAGYNRVGSTGQFRSISGSWTVPSATRHILGEDEYAAEWVGIGGGCMVLKNCPTIVQAGSSQDFVNGRWFYYAWYELYPNPPHTVQLRANPGDRLSVSLTETPRGSKNWHIVISNLTVGKSVQPTVNFPRTTYNTAEWIVERPSDATGSALPLPKVSRVLFTGATVNGAPAALRSTERMFMVNDSGQVIARSTLPKANGTSFAVCTYSASCS